MIEIADYDAAWPEAFRGAAVRLRAAAPLIVSVEHIGSTAVPGLAAKPVIDLMPAVAIGHRKHLDACVEPIVSLGYTYVPEYEDEFPERRFFRLGAQNASRHNIHLVELGSPFWKRHLCFRDLLREDAEVRAGYEHLKRDLATRFSDWNDYADAKGPFIEAALRDGTSA